MTARVVELAARLEDARYDRRAGSGLNLDAFAALAERISPAERIRVGNRLRLAAYEERHFSSYRWEPDAVVPPEPLGEVWDASVHVWMFGDKVRHITAVAVLRGLYLETYRGGFYDTSRDRFGTQVIARSCESGAADVFGVFWRVDQPGVTWRQVTGELTHDEMATWDGEPSRPDRRGVGPAVAGWLDKVAADATPFRPGWASLVSGAR